MRSTSIRHLRSFLPTRTNAVFSMLCIDILSGFTSLTIPNDMHGKIMFLDHHPSCGATVPTMNWKVRRNRIGKTWRWRDRHPIMHRPRWTAIHDHHQPRQPDAVVVVAVVMTLTVVVVRQVLHLRWQTRMKNITAFFDIDNNNNNNRRTDRVHSIDVTCPTQQRRITFDLIFFSCQDRIICSKIDRVLVQSVSISLRGSIDI